MAATAAPYGLIPVKNIGSQTFNGGSMLEVRMSANVASNFYTGDLITMGVATAGLPGVLGATPTTSTRGLLGVLVGVSYIDPTLKYYINAPYLPTGAYTAGYRDIRLYVCDDPDTLFQVQASGAVARAKQGGNAPLANFGGSATTGKSSVHLLAASIANTATLAVRIVDFVESVNSTAGDAYTDLIVKFNFGVHSYTQSDGATNL